MKGLFLVYGIVLVWLIPSFVVHLRERREDSRA